MGVPKFYRWLSERYPCLSQVIKEHQIPDFDNLYLDMNGIIHPCSHPNDDDAHFRITEAEIFQNIFNYIEVLFRIIRPQKNFFMAVDGCAPRAKMNQQRSRRFRTAKDAEDNIRKALMKGHTLPTTERFDSNCITPGTEFMARLQDQLKYFVNNKISTDPLWQNCNIYLSGHSVPGEGEHKIMDFIRYCKSQPGYDVNTRHCLYGLDADLIILGMVTHEPHFALLREEVRYGKDAKKMIRPEAQTFHLLHLSLLRQYLDFEFQGLQASLHFQYNLERVIDDWVILGFLVGNDFVPHLPNLHINHDALPYLFNIYKEFLPTTDGYINDGGHLNIYRLKKFFEVLSKFDRDHFTNIYADVKWLESKGAGNMLHKDKKDYHTPNKKFSELLKLSNQFEDSPISSWNVSGMEDMFGGDTPEKSGRVVGDNDLEVDLGEAEDEETFELEFKQHKRHYYMEKFDMDIVESEQIHTICYEYVRAIQWISHYYFNGLQSWCWYYPYHYSPYVSDIAALEPRELEFDMAQPFYPYEQLLAVLPSASKRLLPQAYQSLMIDENSAIIDFYPLDFQTDLNGKQQDWEAVVLIPFINETRLLNAMMPHSQHLTDEEKERNFFGSCYKYSYDKDLNFMYKSSYPGEFDDINVCKAAVESIDREKYHIDPLQIRKGLLKGTKLDVYCHGFPTMKHLKMETELKKAGVKVFQQHSRNENMVIKITSPTQQNMKTLARELVGENVFVEWPYMVEAQVVSICNESERYYLDEKEGNALVSRLINKGDEYNKVKSDMKTSAQQLMDKRGVQVGPVQVLVEVKLLMGQRYVCGEDGSVHLRKEWKEKTNVYPYQTVVQNLEVHNPEVEVCDSLRKLYHSGALVFLLHTKHYGNSAEVIEVVENRVRVLMKVPPEPNLQELISNHGVLSVHYIPDRTIAQRLGIRSHLLGRITGNLYVLPDGHDEKSQNIGLKMKYSGQNKELLGFARRTDSGWTYSPIAVDILRAYIDKFPDVFEGLGKCSSMDRYPISQLLPGRDNAYLDEIKAFLRQQQCHNAEPVRCGSNTLDHPIVEKIKNAVEEAKESGNDRCLKMTVKPHFLFRPSEHMGVILPDPNTEFFLFDRVLNVQYGIAVPIGLRGTIIGFHDVPTDENDSSSPTEIRYEVLFDDSFLVDGGNSLKRGYFMSSHSLLNISYGERKENEKQGASSSASSVQCKISHLPCTPSTPTGSSYGSRTPGSNNSQSQRTNQQSPHSSQNTPRNNQHSTPNYGNQRGSYSTPSNKYNKNNDNLVSPDYWLKGSYANASNFQPPQPRRQILQHTPGNQQHSGGNQQHSGGNQQHSGGNKQQHGGGNVHKKYDTGNDNHDFLSMWTEMQKTENVKNSPASRDEVKDMNDATAMLHQMLKIKDPAQSATSQHMSPKQKGAQALPQGNPNLYNQQRSMNTQRAPLLNYMPQQKMMSPSAYHQQSQGGYSLFGTPPSSSQSQSTAFQQLCGGASNVPMQYPYNVQQNPKLSPVSQGASPLNFRMNPQQMGQPISSYQFPAPMMQSPVMHQTPQTYHVSQQGAQHQFQQSKQFQQRPGGILNTPPSGEKQRTSVNPFIPHQVLMKNTNLRSTDADNEIKEILGIKSSVSDEKLPTKESVCDEKPAIATYENIVLPQSLETKPLSDDEKLKGLLGIKPMVESSLTTTQTSNPPMSRPLATQNVSNAATVTSVAGTSNSLSRPTETQSVSNTGAPPTVTGATSNVGNQNVDGSVPQNSSGTQNKKPQILLAPSFFGPKKKSL